MNPVYLTNKASNKPWTNFFQHCYCFVKLEDGTGSLPDPSLPLAHQLEFALAKLAEHVRTISDTKATCKKLEEVPFPVLFLTH